MVQSDAVNAFMNVFRLRFSMEKNGSRTGNFFEPHRTVCSRMWGAPVESRGGVRNPTANRLLSSALARCNR